MSKRFKIAEFYENICKLFWQGWVIFLKEAIFYTQFSMILLWLKFQKTFISKL